MNEAMCAGLPIVVSREVGCAADLVRDGVNGCTPVAGDVAGLAKALQSLIENEDLRRRQGQQNLARILQGAIANAWKALAQRWLVWNFAEPKPSRLCAQPAS